MVTHRTASPLLGDVETCRRAIMSARPANHDPDLITLWKGNAPMADEEATPVLDVLAAMTVAAVETTTLDPALQILVRFAALVAQDAAPASYLFHFGAGADQGLTLEDAQQVLVTLAPLVGTARIVSATSKIERALGLALAVISTDPGVSTVIYSDDEDAESM